MYYLHCKDAGSFKVEHSPMLTNEKMNKKKPNQKKWLSFYMTYERLEVKIFSNST